jgi:hypothetical protein
MGWDDLMIEAPSAHATPEETAALAEGGLTGEPRERLVAHLADCADCRELFAATLKTIEELKEGTAIGAGESGGASLSPTTRWVERVASERRRQFRLVSVFAAAAAISLATAVVLQQVGVRRSAPPSRSEWLAHMPPSRELVPWLWGGNATRGESQDEALTRQSAEVGALLVDLEVAMAAGDGPRTQQLAKRLAALLEDAGLMDEEAARLRRATQVNFEQLPAALRTEVPRVEQAARERFLSVYLDLGAFAEEVRIAAIGRQQGFADSRAARRYGAWLLAQREHPLPVDVRDALTTLQRKGLTRQQTIEAATAVLRGLTR